MESCITVQFTIWALPATAANSNDGCSSSPQLLQNSTGGCAYVRQCLQRWKAIRCSRAAAQKPLVDSSGTGIGRSYSFIVLESLALVSYGGVVRVQDCRAHCRMAVSRESAGCPLDLALARSASQLYVVFPDMRV